MRYFWFGIIGFVLGSCGCHATHSYARSGGGFASSAEVKEWFENLRQPDNARLSCCSNADAYWSDSFEASPDGQYVAIITDERGYDYDVQVGRMQRAPGERFTVPDYKIKWDKGNPTGHGVLFVSPTGFVLCYVPPGGV